MRLSAFITGYMDQILGDWDEYALTMKPAADEMSLRELRDHAEQMLRAVALDIETPQTEGEEHAKSLGGSDDPDASNAASMHGQMRHDSHFTLVQLTAEFRALRASVLCLWRGHVEGSSPEVLEQVMRFNEAIDQALAESICTFSKRADYARDMFDAILGHDLRGPLSTIALAGELLTRAELPPEKARELGVRVNGAARYMSAMVGDLLEFARRRLGGGILSVHPHMANLVEVCNGALADAHAMHPNSEFELVANAKLDARIDADRIHQLLVNLLGNAGQHGAPGRPIQLHLAGDTDEVVLCVINEGGRIPAASLKRIFEPMVRLKPGADSDKGIVTSLGLGLHIAREIAQAHGGSLAAGSDDLHTTFTVRLPKQGPEKAESVDPGGSQPG